MTLVVKDGNGATQNVATVLNGSSQHQQVMASQLSGTATKANVAAATSSTQLIASNTARLGASVFNDSTSAMYINLGSSATTTAFVVKLAPASYYEIPFNYTGVVNGIWDTATGAARVCEFAQ
jgi:hypothetical protein